MSLDPTVSGRAERRLPIIVVVRLAPVERAAGEAEERTYTDNVSAHGARLFSKRPWKPDDEILVTPRNEETTSAKVVYCQRLADDHFAIGVKFQNGGGEWSIIHRYDGAPFDPSSRTKSTISG
ncbi:MAG: PilZ domain-containing protein [Candidatus Acidiferrum sp.]